MKPSNWEIAEDFDSLTACLTFFQHIRCSNGRASQLPTIFSEAMLATSPPCSAPVCATPATPQLRRRQQRDGKSSSKLCRIPTGWLWLFGGVWWMGGENSGWLYHVVSYRNGEHWRGIEFPKKWGTWGWNALIIRVSQARNHAETTDDPANLQVIGSWEVSRQR